MNISLTIPQMFYDLLARVLPGSLFLFMLNFEFAGTKLELSKLIPISTNNSMAIVLSILVFIVFSYFMGWILLAGTFLSLNKTVRERHESGLNKNSPSLSEMYQRIRIKDESVGFRIVKLRAEARMIETSRSGMFYIFIISFFLLLSSKASLFASINQSSLVWAIKLIVPLIIGIALWKSERRLWNNYYGNIPINYEILFETRVRNVGDKLRELRDTLKKGENTSQIELDELCKIWENRIKPSEKDKELFVLVDSKGNFIQPKLTAPRWLCHLLALRHRCVHILLQWENPTLGDVFMIQVRSWDKTDSPGHLDISIGGHVVGEASSHETAYKEMEEEFGITKADLRNGELNHSSGYESYNERFEDNFYNAEWRDVYLGEIATLDKIHFRDKEVVGLYLCPKSEAKNLLLQKHIPIASALELSLPRCL